MSGWHIALRWLGGLVSVVVLYVAATLGWAFAHDRAPAGAPMNEYMTANEPYNTAQIISSAIGLSLSSREKLLSGKLPLATDARTAPGFSSATYRRDVHAKSHGCVRASFTVPASVPERFAVGLFSRPATYQAIIRFSSGQPKLNPDSVPDARGFAIKVLGVPGEKLLPDATEAGSQDFVMINSPVFFIRTIDEYLAFSKALGQGDAATAAYFFPSKWKLWESRPREYWLARSSFKKRPASLVTETYYSLSAYRLGPREYVKYSMRPCAGNHPMVPAGAKDPGIDFDYLREELANQSAAGQACFDFAVQPQVAGKDMPVEDATVNWSEKDSPFVPIARVTFEPGVNNTAEKNGACENLSFNPWHSLPEHEPVGVMNRVRKVLYQSMAGYRRAKNGQQPSAIACAGSGPGGGCPEGCSGTCVAVAHPVSTDPASQPHGHVKEEP